MKNEEIMQGIDEVIAFQKEMSASFPDSPVDYRGDVKILETAKEILATGKKGKIAGDSFNDINRLANRFARNYINLVAVSGHPELYKKHYDFAVTLAILSDALFSAYAEGVA